MRYLKIEELTESYFKLTTKEKWAFQTVIGVKKKTKNDRSTRDELIVQLTISHNKNLDRKIARNEAKQKQRKEKQKKQ